jgi:orotate phosphoribosyltransferase-like protein
MPRQGLVAIQGRHELKTQFVELRTRGLSYARIAKKLKVAKATLGLHYILYELLRAESFIGTRHAVPIISAG